MSSVDLGTYAAGAYANRPGPQLRRVLWVPAGRLYRDPTGRHMSPQDAIEGPALVEVWDDMLRWYPGQTTLPGALSPAEAAEAYPMEGC